MERTVWAGPPSSLLLSHRPRSIMPVLHTLSPRIDMQSWRQRLVHSVGLSVNQRVELVQDYRLSATKRRPRRRGRDRTEKRSWTPSSGSPMKNKVFLLPEPRIDAEFVPQLLDETRHTAAYSTRRVKSFPYLEFLRLILGQWSCMIIDSVDSVRFSQRVRDLALPLLFRSSGILF
jgi:hypothetical protein